MAKRKIRLNNDEILRKKSKPVKEITPKIITLLEDMEETMRQYDGVGLAAVQVGSLRRIVIIDVGDGLVEMINPEILSMSGEQVSNEGCLSIPGYSAHVDRPNVVEVKFFDRKMEEHNLLAEEYFAVAVCHELDHLDGVLFTDKSYELEDEDADNE